MNKYDYLNGTQDLSLSDWGPYARDFFTLSHIGDVKKGMRMDFLMVPGICRRKFCPPETLRECDYSPWEASGDFSFFSCRQQMVDHDVFYAETAYCKLSDKFRVNSFIVIPAALLVLVGYFFMGTEVSAPQHQAPVEWMKVMPYLVVLMTAIFGMNVMAVLTLGIILTGLIGLFSGSFDIYGWFSSMGEGILSMGELIIVTMMAGGMLELIRQQGGIDFIIRLLTKRVNSKLGAELSIATLVSLVDVCTANNTVAILTVGDISKRIGDRYGVDNKKCASILDTFSCTIQGLIPYGAQMLIAAGLASLNPVSILPYLYYPFVLGIIALLSIFLRYPRRYS